MREQPGRATVADEVSPEGPVLVLSSAGLAGVVVSGALVRLICPDCGIPLVPFGGEDVCTAYCDSCDSHDCHCYRDDGEDTELLDDDGVWVDTGVPARPEQKQG